MKKISLRILIISFISLTVVGCGYTTRSLITKKFKTIYIAQFANKVDITKEQDNSRRYRLYRPLLEIEISRAVIDRFMFDANLRIAKEAFADLILKGSLVDYRRDVLRYTSDEEEVEEYRITIAVDLALMNSDQELLWEEKNFMGDYTYFVSGPNAKSETTATQEAVEDLARRVVERVVEEW